MHNSDKGTKRKAKYISYKDSGSYLGTAGVGVSTGVGDMVEAEVGSLSVVALVATAGDEHDWFFPIPRDLNVLKPIGVRIHYSTASTTAADTHTWISLYDILGEDVAFAVGTTAMDTPHVAASDTDSGVANARQMSTRAVINGGTITEAQMTSRAWMTINVELDATDAAETIHLHGIEIDYVPKRYLGPTWTQNPALTDE